MNTIDLINKINNDIRDAEFNKDTAVLQTIIADDLQFRRASGTLVDKDTLFPALTDPLNTYSELENINITSSLNLTEDQAISVVIVRATGKRGPEQKPFSGDLKKNRFFRKQKNW